MHLSSDFMAAVTICNDFRAQEEEICHCHFVPSTCHEAMGPDVMILVFLIFSLKPALSLSLTSSRSFLPPLHSVIRVVLSTYLRLLIFLLPTLIPACNSYSLAFLMMYSVYRLNKQGDSRQLCSTPFSILNQSVVPAVQFNLVTQCVHLFATQWTAACQSISTTNSWSLHKLMSTESVMPSSQLILCHPLLLMLSIYPSIRVFSSESVLCIRWPKYWSFTSSISPSNGSSGLFFFRIDWFDLFAVQGTLKSLLQHHSSKASIFNENRFQQKQKHKQHN